MTRLGRILKTAVAIPVSAAAAVGVARLVNGRRYPTPHGFPDDLGNSERYSLDQPGMKITRLHGDYLNGFDLAPSPQTREGLIVIWGGSEGGPDFNRAVRLASQGYRVLSLFYFGQPNQQPRLAGVPLEFFEEVLAWRDENAADGPLTVIGTSRGAELALVLQARYAQIDNVVVYSPTRYAWQGLDFRHEQSSWSWHGAPVPYVSFRNASTESSTRMFWAMLTNTPIPLRMQYASAAVNDQRSEAARIPFMLSGNLLAFAGDDDAMWPSERAAEYWAQFAPGRTEAHVFAGAGHLFGPLEGWAGGYQMGGSWGANQAAMVESNAILDARLAAWHPVR